MKKQVKKPIDKRQQVYDQALEMLNQKINPVSKKPKVKGGELSKERKENELLSEEKLIEILER